MHETDITWPGADGAELAGSLLLPGHAAPGRPAALLLGGSGPVDRDSNLAGQRSNITKALAIALAEAGIASLRYDKRGTGSSGGDFLVTGFHDETGDAATALGELRGVEGIDPARVGVVGHSAGAVVAVRLAAAAPAPAFAVLLAGAARPGLAVMRWQSERIAETLPGPTWLLGPAFRSVQALVRRLLLRSRHDTVRIGLGREPARWFREYMAYDPSTDLPAIGCPTLAITGAKDLQVDARDLVVIGDLVTGPCTVHAPENLTHLLCCTTERHTVLQYRHLVGRPLDTWLAARVGNWIAAATDPND